MGPAEFVLNRAIEILATVRFRAEHGGFELSNDHGIKVLAIWEKIVKAVIAAYPGSDARSTSLRNKIQKFMESTKYIAEPLLYISKVLKYQEKVKDVVLKKLEIALVKHSVAWRIVFPNKKVFVKLHRLEAHVRDFILRYRFFGLVSEEGFEAFHPHIARVMDNVRSMVSITGHIKTIFRRLSVGLNEPVQTEMTKGAGRDRRKGAWNLQHIRFLPCFREHEHCISHA